MSTSVVEANRPTIARTTTAPLSSQIQRMINLSNDARKSIKGRDRRSSERHAYNSCQLIAPITGQKMPSQEAFRLVQFRDLSQTGCAFIAESKPRHKRYVVCLGSTPFKFFVAEVVRVQQQTEMMGSPWLVGCRFINQCSDEDG